MIPASSCLQLGSYSFNQHLLLAAQVSSIDLAQIFI